VWRVRESAGAVEADVWLENEQRSLTVRAEQLIWAAPAFVLPRVWPEMPPALAAAAKGGDYAPWLVANLHLSELPQERRGIPAAWDNVLYEGQGLGYVVATHQLIRRHLRGTVLTYYRPLSESAPAEARRQLLDTPREVWAEQILQELSLPHPDIRRLTTRLDVFRFGHAMRRPVPGSLWGGARERLAADHPGRVSLAHADLSGFSIFEEAQYRGLVAAERVLRRLAVRFASSLV
ncbi:MAG TPA: twin-arginine translocation pathway signal protein, partial [Rhodocyclaceae bacterium]|nr:twin-arginine translocation pathway signal protein [Rhodocyclaceae bacterium]